MNKRRNQSRLVRALTYCATVLMTAIMLWSCHSITRVKSGEIEQNFDPVQRAMILSEDSLAPMRVYKINNYSDSILLRTKSENVIVDSSDQVLQNFISRLYRTVIDSISMGVGIAAPQVGILKNIIWVQRFDKPNLPFEVYLNPKITKYSEEKQPCLEGCLSIPGRADTTKTRAQFIDLVYDTFKSTQVSERVEGFTAVIFQHEIDHLDGILYLDHLEKESK